MSRLPVCSGADAVKAFGKIGYVFDHQTGSHIILRHASGRRLSVPNHRELAKGTLRALRIRTYEEAGRCEAFRAQPQLQPRVMHSHRLDGRFARTRRVPSAQRCELFKTTFDIDT